MRESPLLKLQWFISWVLLVATGVLAIVRLDIAQRRDTFQAEARIAHRLLSQRAAQQDAILATLALLGPTIAAQGRPEQRLPAVYPQVLAVIRRDGGHTWPDQGLDDAERRSRISGHAELGPVDVRTGQYTLVQASDPSSFALRIDVQRMVPWHEWPVQQAGPVRVVLAHAGQALVLQSGQSADAEPFGLTAGFVFAKRLAPDSQPFALQLRQATGPAYWPWPWLLVWVGVSTLALIGFAGWQRARRSTRRAQQLLQFGQVARLNAMGELAAGMAHELNQPLSAIVTNAQATRRILADDAPALDTVRHAVGQIEAQGRRAADVVKRLRQQVESSEKTEKLQPTDLLNCVRQVRNLLESDIRRCGASLTIQGSSVHVLVDPVALEQIIHNLLNNALQALDAVPVSDRTVLISLRSEKDNGVLMMSDSGPGIAAEVLPHLFEPFFSTRRGGLGLGLSLCEALAQAMQGTLTAHNTVPRGAEFHLTLPLARTPT